MYGREVPCLKQRSLSQEIDPVPNFAQPLSILQISCKNPWHIASRPGPVCTRGHRNREPAKRIRKPGTNAGRSHVNTNVYR